VLGRLPSVDYPEAFCLVVGRRRGYVVLTENRGALIAADLLPAYRGVAVWRSFEVLWELVQRGLLGIVGIRMRRFWSTKLIRSTSFRRKI